MKKHRRKCAVWRARPNPTALTILRLRQTRQEQSANERAFEPCLICGKRPDHHMVSCPNSQAEVVRRQALERHGIDLEQFDRFLRVLAKRYESRGSATEPRPAG
jgi:uncharacterized protein (DUF849 family)